jgi:hypothetical protein
MQSQIQLLSRRRGLKEKVHLHDVCLERKREQTLNKYGCHLQCACKPYLLNGLAIAVTEHRMKAEGK